MGETDGGDVVALVRVVWVGVLGRMEDGGQGIWGVVDHGVGRRGGCGAGRRTLGSVGGWRGVVGSKEPLAGAVEEAYIGLGVLVRGVHSPGSRGSCAAILH